MNSLFLGVPEGRRPVLFAGNPLPMWIHDVKSLRFLEVNESAIRQYGYTREEFLRLTLHDIQPSQNAPVQDVLKMLVPRIRIRRGFHVKQDGTPIYVKIRANDVRFRGRQGRYVVAEDVTERQFLSAQLLRLAHHDSLTGLPNRTPA